MNLSAMDFGAKLEDGANGTLEQSARRNATSTELDQSSYQSLFVKSDREVQTDVHKSDENKDKFPNMNIIQDSGTSQSHALRKPVSNITRQALDWNAKEKEEESGSSKADLAEEHCCRVKGLWNDMGQVSEDKPKLVKNGAEGIPESPLEIELDSSLSKQTGIEYVFQGGRTAELEQDVSRSRFTNMTVSDSPVVPSESYEQSLGLNGRINSVGDTVDLSMDLLSQSKKDEFLDQPRRENKIQIGLPNLPSQASIGSMLAYSDIPRSLTSDVQDTYTIESDAHPYHSDSESDMSIEESHQLQTGLDPYFSKSDYTHRNDLSAPCHQNQTDSVSEFLCREENYVDDGSFLHCSLLNFYELPPKLIPGLGGENAKPAVIENADHGFEAIGPGAGRPNSPSITSYRPVPTPRKKLQSTKTASQNLEGNLGGHRIQQQYDTQQTECLPNKNLTVSDQSQNTRLNSVQQNNFQTVESDEVKPAPSTPTSAKPFGKDEEAAPRIKHAPALTMFLQGENSNCDKNLQLQSIDSLYPDQRTEGMETGCNTVMVTGNYLTHENLELCGLYFENTKRSGGGEIKDEGIKWDENRQCIFITFVDCEVARNVASRKHNLSDKAINVELWPSQQHQPLGQPFLAESAGRQAPPPDVKYYTDRFYVSGLPEGITSDYLQNYLECMTEVSVDMVTFNEDNSSLVFFESSAENFDLEQIQEQCQKAPMEDGIHMTFLKVPFPSPVTKTSLPRSVVVTGLNSETATEAIHFFFSNKKRNHGGPVEKIDRIKGHSRAVIHFKDPKDAQSVVKKGEHFLDGNKLCVSFQEETVSVYQNLHQPVTQLHSDICTESKTVASVFETSPGNENHCKNHTVTPPQIQKKEKPGLVSQVKGQELLSSQSKGFAEIKYPDSTTAQMKYDDMTEGEVQTRAMKDMFCCSCHQIPPEQGDVNNIPCSTAYVADYQQQNTFASCVSLAQGDGCKDDVDFERKEAYTGPNGQQTLNHSVINKDDQALKESAYDKSSGQTAQTEIKLGAKIIQQIISDSQLLHDLKTKLKSVDTKFSIRQPDHIVIQRLAKNQAKNWDKIVTTTVDHFLRSFTGSLSNEEESNQIKATAWRDSQLLLEDDESVVKQVSSEVRITEQTIPNLKPCQIKFLKVPRYLEKLSKDYPGLEISVDEGCKTAKVRIPENVEKNAMIDVLSFFTVITESKIRLNPSLLMMYEKPETLEFIQKTMIDRNGLACHWEVCNEQIVISGAASDLRRLEQMLRTTFKEVSIKLEEKQVRLFKSMTWTSFYEELQERTKEGYPSPLLIPKDNQVIIVDIQSNVRSTQLAVEEFFDKNKLEEVHVRMNYHLIKFLQQYHEEKQKAMHARAKKLGVLIQFSKTGMVAEGPKDHMEDIVMEVKRYISKIKEDVMKFSKPGVAKLLMGDQGQEFLKHTGMVTKCYITTESSSDGTSSDHHHLLAETLLMLNQKLQIVQGDITQCKVDGIINAANAQLSHAGGVADAIVKAGGDIIQKESYELIQKDGVLKEGDVAVTRAGSLFCSFVLHAVGPMWNDGQKGEEKTLECTIKTILNKAENLNLTSIAMPAISCGIFLYPVESATETIMRTIALYFSNKKHESCIEKVILISISEEPLKGFLKAAKNLFGKRLAIRGELKTSAPQEKPDNAHSSKDGSNRHSHHSHRDRGQGNNSQAPIRIISGEIAKSRADVVVCTIHPSLDLRKGLLSKSILEEGGDIIQQDLTRYLEKYNNTQIGSVVYTSGGNLSCKAVYHLSLPTWFDDHGQKMCSAVKDCLNLANKKGAKSIAFPTLGTGRLGYPCDQVASKMFSVIGQWFQSSHRKSIEDVQIIVYSKDKETLEVFQSVERGGGNRYGDRCGNDKQGRDHTRGRHHGHQDRGGGDYSGSPGKLKTTVGKVTVMVKEGNILAEPCDAIVNSSNDNLDLSVGVLSKEIGKICGPDIYAECKDQRSTMLEKGVAITSMEASGLSCGNIIHISADRFKQDWQKGVLTALQTADSARMASVALPALGTGGRGADTFAMAQAMKKAVSKFSEQARSLKEIRVVIFQKQMLSIYINAFDSSAARTGAEGTGLDQGDDSHNEKQVLQEAAVYIYSDNESAIKEAKEKITTHIQQVLSSHSVKNVLIASFTPKQVQDMFKLQNKHSVDIKLDRKNCVITVSGIDIDVAKAISDFKDIMLSATTQRHLDAGMPPVRWQYQTGKDKFADFDQEIVIIIEAAYKKKEHEVHFADKIGRKYKIVFKEWKEYCLDQSKPPVSVKRRDLIEESKQDIPLPKHWEPMKNDKVKKVQLKPDSNEYNKVAAHFGQRTTIKKIERIQNPTLFQQFKVKKKELEMYNSKGTENEKRLFHGTSSDCVDSIIANGFNRSYCGRHGTALGAGVYFAAHSSTSLNYAQGGNMFQARVLVGEYTQGSSAMRMAPNKPGSQRPYDSVADASSNASVFVIFHDSQAYPEYLISF